MNETEKTLMFQRKMGGVVGTLTYLYCASGCQASVVASALAFHPPVPTYEFDYSEAGKKFTARFLLDVGYHKYMNYDLDQYLTVDLLETRNHTKLPVFYYRHPEATKTILYSHGNASDCGIMNTLFILMVARLKVNIIAYDYTGYGVSRMYGIRPTEKQTYQDITTVYEWALEKKYITNPEKELILYGQSVGSGPSCFLGSKKQFAGLILHSPILSGLRVITDSRLLACFDIFPNINRIHNVKCPVFIIHGDSDIEVPIRHGQGLYNAVEPQYQYTPWWVTGKGHNDVITDNEEEFLRQIRNFLDHVK